MGSDLKDIAGMKGVPEFSIVTTCYFEEESIEEFHRRMTEALAGTGRTYEMVMVNDGSTDGTFEKLRRIQRDDEHVCVILDLFRNAGQAAAISAGIVEARGRYIVLMDSDLQLDPEELPLLMEKLDEGCDIVSGYRVNRKDSLARTVPSRIANMIMRAASRSSLRDFGCTFKIFDARLIRAFDYGPAEKFNQVDVIAQAARIEEVPVTHRPRKYGTSGWTFGKLFAFNMDNLVRLSEKPFQVLAASCFAISVLLLVRILISFFVSFTVIDDVTNALILYSVIISLLLIVAVLSIIGEFVIRIFARLQKRPLYIVRERVSRDAVRES